VTGPDADPPELREPDLPRTAKVRPRALRTGWTTGTCASAAAKAATTALRDQRGQDSVEVALPSQRRVRFDLFSCGYEPAQATAVVVKDAGDDPDVTHGAHLTANVRWRLEPGSKRPRLALGHRVRARVRRPRPGPGGTAGRRRS